MTVYTGDGKEQRGFLDWNGDLIFSFDRKKMIGLRSTFAAEGGLVLAGNEVGGSSNAKIMKVDMQGNVIWETVLPMMMKSVFKLRTADTWSGSSNPIVIRINGLMRWHASI